jgi:uncharacterized protein (TIGR03792 family)
MGVVEILRFGVHPERAGEFVARNEEVWTPALRARPGFLRREIMIGPGRDEIVILVWWRDREALESFPRGELEALERRMEDLVLRREEEVLEQLLPAG